jgi:hypothetical protein
LKDSPGAVEITDGNGNSVKLGTSGIVVNSAARGVGQSQIDIEPLSCHRGNTAGVLLTNGVHRCATQLPDHATAGATEYS